MPAMALAQFSGPDVKFTKEEKYLYPINPGTPGSLAGTMGELRQTHFHSGIDIRTNNMVGYAVRASKSGYISRASMSTSGYGNVIFITHPDGKTTLYAHLDKFTGALARYVLEEQYRRKTSEIDLFFHGNQFLVSQGDTIAFSGNSGSSGGPHLHFDIRDRDNNALNPLIEGAFPEITDNLSPAPEKIALRTLDASSRINDRFGRFEFYGRKVGANDYSIATPILASGLIGIELLAKDKLAYKSPFYGGVNYIEVWMDSALVFRQSIEKLDMSETRAIYTVMDFKTMRNKGTRFYKLYIDDGNALKFYGSSPTSGKIKVKPNKLSSIQIKMKDSHNNVSSIFFKLMPNPVEKQVMSLEPMPGTEDLSYEIFENTLMITARPLSKPDSARLYFQGTPSKIEADYANANRRVYLIDLRKKIPDSVTIGNKTIAPKIHATISPANEYKFYSDRIEVQFPNGALYDTLYFNTDYQQTARGNEVFTVGSRNVPLNKSIGVSVKTSRTYPKNGQYAVYRSSGRSFSYIGGEWINGLLHFNTREFGEFTILKDSIAPSIRPVYINNQTVRFKIRDELSGIASFEASINGEWLLMHYDYKTAAIWSERADKKAPLKGDFVLTVTDNAGNKNIFTQRIQ
jgi:hypothetical protein